MSRSIQRDVPIVPWHSILSSIVAPQKSFAEALGVRGAELFAQVSREAHEAASGFSSSLWRDVYAGMNRDELDLAYNRALSDGASKHVAMALNAARDWPAGDIRAELLLRLNEEDKTCIFLCAEQGYIATAQVLLQAALEAQVLERLVLMLSMDGSAGCIEWSLLENDDDMLKLIFQYIGKARRTRQWGAPENSCMSELLQITVTDVMIEQGSCLSIAARYENSRTLKRLINVARVEGILGLLLTMRCDDESTCLHQAAYEVVDENVRLLLDAAKEVDLQDWLVHAKNREDFTCLHKALTTEVLDSKSEVFKVTQTLVAAGGALLVSQTVPRSRKTALHLAVDRGHPQTIPVLLDVGGEGLLLQTAERGRSAMHDAAEEYNHDCLKQLLICAKGLGDAVLQEALLQKDENGKTCFMLAQEYDLDLNMSLVLVYAQQAGVARENLIN